MRILENCEPKRVMYYFEEICAIPHGSGDTEKLSDYLVTFAKNQNLKWYQDELGNVVIYKAATEGYENAPTVILQGHMDMVCEKRPDVEHDFSKDGLKLFVDGDEIGAEGTTLGGDNGIAVAYGLALLESQEICHPALEVVITVDEETGLLGAAGLDCSVLKGKRLINLDSEAEGSIWVSCAGGAAGCSHIPVQRIEAEGQKVLIRIHGLLGGHSGAEIDKKRASSNILAGRMLYALKKEMDFEISVLEGGQKDNAITRETVAEILISVEDLEKLQVFAKEYQKKLREEYAQTDEGIQIDITDLGYGKEMIISPISREKILFYLMQVPFGVQKMSGTIENLVETSTNLGIMQLEKDVFYACSSMRSSITSAKEAISNKIEYLTEFLGGEYEMLGVYPAWEYRKESPLRDKMAKVYEEMYGKQPELVAIHAGLECGLFYEKIEDLDCVSIGPDMKDIHTSEERLFISSTERVWKYLCKVLESMKN